MEVPRGTGGGVKAGMQILVGYDGSAGAAEALTWAAMEARARESLLTVCLVRAPELAPSRANATVGAEAVTAEQHLAAGLKLARSIAGQEAVQPLLADGPVAATLCERSGGAEMVVVGSRGHGGMPGLPVGSVGLQVASHGRGRIVVVRGSWQPVPGRSPLPVVAGVDGSPSSGAALAFAFEEADLRRTYLVAVCALADDPGVLGAAGRIKESFEDLVSHYERQNPDISVERRVSEGSPRATLLEAAAEAQLITVGARGRGGFEDMAIGSVGLAMLAYAGCPVGVEHAR
jgi:nucleotide-binding universal stress UspA family protein